jgi:anthranilate synthase/phosphoribosyltransferase
MILIIDNYDSFTYNLFQYISALTTEEVRVIRNDRITVEELTHLNLSALIVSPGPGRPEDAGISIAAIKALAGTVPILGVCLGHQAIGAAYGASIGSAGRIVHGKTDLIELDGRGLFRGLPSHAEFTRYHSLVVERASLPPDFEVTANSADGEVMGIRHRELLIEGVQFHPESIASAYGQQVLANFLQYRREPFPYSQLLSQVLSGAALSQAQAAELMDELTEGRLSGPRIAALLVALAGKGYTPEEVAGFASVLKRKKLPVRHAAAVVDTCGTGGDGLATFNISSLAAIVAAACGADVAKHGNRGVSSPTGSADFFSALGVPTDLSPDQASLLLEETGFAFMFAPTYHGAMRHAGPVRADLGIKTVLNLLGPLVNPAEAESQVIGVYDESLCALVARAARLLGVRRVLVVHGDDGLDELSVTAPSHVVEVGPDDELREWSLDPTALGIAAATLPDLRGGTAEHNARIAEELLAGGGPVALRDAVALNAGAALYISGHATDIGGGYRAAVAALADGTALTKLADIRAYVSVLQSPEAAVAASAS